MADSLRIIQQRSVTRQSTFQKQNKLWQILLMLFDTSHPRRCTGLGNNPQDDTSEGDRGHVGHVQPYSSLPLSFPSTHTHTWIHTNMVCSLTPQVQHSSSNTAADWSDAVSPSPERSAGKVVWVSYTAWAWQTVPVWGPRPSVNTVGEQKWLVVVDLVNHCVIGKAM